MDEKLRFHSAWPSFEESFLPPDVAQLPTVVAEPWLLVDSDFAHPGMEGPAFDRDGRLYICRVPAGPGASGRIIRVSPDKSIETVFKTGATMPVGIAIHKDGRLFAACLTGEILIITPDGKLERTIYPELDGQKMHLNDLVFDSAGNLYFTDFRGPMTAPEGGVYRYDAAGDYTVLKKVVDKISWPNGISLTSDESALLIGAGGRNEILMIKLQKDGSPARGSNNCIVIYRNSGVSVPDSNKLDSSGNLYQAMMHGGRILILNSRGIPVGNVLAPGCDQGKNLMCSNLAIRPDASEGYMLTADPELGTQVFKFPTLAAAQKLYSHF